MKECQICNEEIDTSFYTIANLTAHLMEHINHGTIEDYEKIRGLVFKEKGEVK